MNIPARLFQSIRAGFRLAGYDVTRLHNNPKYTLLGLRSIPFQTVIDVGANMGQFARYIQGLYADSKVYCFEPVPDSFAALEKWAKTQNGRIVPFNLAVGDVEGGNGNDPASRTCYVLINAGHHGTDGAVLSTYERTEAHSNNSNYAGQCARPHRGGAGS